MGLIAIREDEDKAATDRRQHCRATSCSASCASACSSAWRARSTATTCRSSTRSACSHPASASRSSCRCCSAAAARCAGPVLGAFIIEPLNELANNAPRRRQRAAAALRRAAGAGRGVPAATGILPDGGQRCCAAGARAARPGLVGARLETGRLEPLATVAGQRGRAPTGPRRCWRCAGCRSASAASSAVDGARFAVPRGLDHRADRTQRLGQDDGVQPDRRHHGGRRGRDPVRRRADRRRCRPGGGHTAGIGRTFQITRLFARDDRAGERRRAAARLLADAARPAAVSGTEAERGRGAARLRRHAAAYRDQQAARAVLRPAEARRAGAGADARPEADPARRARGRHQPDADRADGRHDPRTQRARKDVPDRRAQHAVRARPVRPDPRARARGDDRLRHARRRSSSDPPCSTPTSATTSTHDQRQDCAG